MVKTSSLVLVALLSGCAAQSATGAPASPEASAAATNTPESSAANGSAANGPAANAPAANAPAANAPPQSGTSAPPASGTPATEPSPPPPAGTPTLPAVAVKSVGMHIGGGPNDAAGKAPFEKAIEQRFPDFLRCYRLVTEPEPGKGGTFGVDLHIERTGGKPRVDQPRSALGAEPFRACMLSIFESIQFPAMKKPFVVSYSLRFTVES